MSVAQRLFKNQKPFIGLAFPLAAMAIALLLTSLNSSSDVNYFESQMSITFDSRLNIPTPSISETRIQTVTTQSDGSFLSNEIDHVAFEFKAPFSTQISENGRTITFLARDHNDSTTVSFVEAAANRFVAKRSELALFSTPTTTVQLGGIEAAGLRIGPSMLGLILIAVLAIFAAATRESVRPVSIRTVEDRTSLSSRSGDDLRI